MSRRKSSAPPRGTIDEDDVLRDLSNLTISSGGSTIVYGDTLRREVEIAGKGYRAPPDASVSAPVIGGRFTVVSGHATPTKSSRQRSASGASASPPKTVPRAGRAPEPVMPEESVSAAPRRQARASAPPLVVQTPSAASTGKGLSVRCSGLNQYNDQQCGRTVRVAEGRKAGLCPSHQSQIKRLCMVTSPITDERVSIKDHMALWMQHSTHEKMKAACKKPTASAASGFIYVNLVRTNREHEIALKVGRSNNPQRRVNEHCRRCKSTPHRQWYYRRTDSHVCVERLLHLALRDLQKNKAYHHPMFPAVLPPPPSPPPKEERICDDCKSAHVEIYLFNKRLPDGTRLRTDDFVDIVHDLMKLCRKFVHTYIAPAPDSDSEEGESGDAFNYDSNDDSNEDW